MAPNSSFRRARFAARLKYLELGAMSKLILIIGLVILTACSESPSSESHKNSRGEALPAAPPGPDFRDLLDGKCLANNINPVALNDYESCFVTELSKQCSPANDCLISCLVSGQARQIGGGCWHACFQELVSYNAYHEPAQAARCRLLDPYQTPHNSFKPRPLLGSP